MQNKLFQPDAETAVLSILLKNDNLVYNINGLRWFMFSSSPHQLLFKEIEDFAEAQSLPNAEIICASLESKGKLNTVGGKKYLEYLVEQSYQKENFKNYIDIVIASYKARKVVEIASELIPENLNSDNIDVIIGQTKRSLDEIVEHIGTSSTIHVGETTKDAYEEIVARTKNPGVRGTTWGLQSIDRVSGGKSGGDFWIISGRPSQGKTAVLCNSVLADAKNNVPSLIFEKEMRPQELVERFIAIETGIPITNIRLGLLKQDQINKIHDSLKAIKEYPIYIDNSYTNSDLYYLEATVNKYKRLHDIKNVYMDYIQLFSDRDDGQTAELGRISRLSKLLANQLDICMVVLSQLNRGVESRENKRPLMSDLRQSGNLEEDADFVVGLYRDDYYNKDTKDRGLMEFIIQKARSGPVGTILTKFEAETNRMYDLR